MTGNPMQSVSISPCCIEPGGALSVVVRDHPMCGSAELVEIQIFELAELETRFKLSTGLAAVRDKDTVAGILKNVQDHKQGTLYELRAVRLLGPASGAVGSRSASELLVPKDADERRFVLD